MMDFVKEWTFSLCISLIVSVVITLLMPSGSVGRYGKMIVSVFIFLSLLLPLRNVTDISFVLDSSDFAVSSSESENTYSSLIEAEVERELIKKGVDGSSSKCEISLNNNDEIEIKSLEIFIADNYDKEEIRQYIYDTLGFAAEVYYIGE